MKTQRIPDLSERLAAKQPLVLFDGECTLCSRSVRFLLRHNHSGNLNFTSLQSKTGSEIAMLAGKGFEKAETLMLLQDNMLYSYSSAALKIAAHLDSPWQILGIFSVVPTIIRDTLYQFIANNRYAWFGKKPFCMTDEKGYQKRFLS
jgi:predicted DCC family thiol-disulfide oxidoreductase YuxK